jgi:hypothetical protein
LVATVNQAPFSYSVNTKSLRNGKYTLTTKTTYESGKIESSNSDLFVKNPMNLTQIMLQLRHYAWVLLLLALIFGGVIWFMFFRRSGDEYGDSDVSGTFGTPGTYDTTGGTMVPPAGGTPPSSDPYGRY